MAWKRDSEEDVDVVGVWSIAGYLSAEELIRYVTGRTCKQLRAQGSHSAATQHCISATAGVIVTIGRKGR
jgi:hypothetical protein